MKQFRTALVGSTMIALWAVLACLFPFRCYGQTRPATLPATTPATTRVTTAPAMQLAPPAFGLDGTFPYAQQSVYIYQRLPAGVDPRDHTITWDLAGPPRAGGRAWRQLGGVDLAFVCESPGSYRLSRRVDGGSPVVFGFSLGLAPGRRTIYISPRGSDANAGTISAPRKTAPDLRDQAHVLLLYEAGQTHDLGETGILAQDARDIVISRYGPASLANPVLLVHSIAFTTWGGTHNFAVFDVAITASDPAKGYVMIPRGMNITLCRVHVSQIENAIYSCNVVGFSCEDVSVDVLQGYGMYLDSCWRPCLVNVNLAGSVHQEAFRSTGVVGLQGGLIFGGRHGQPAPDGYKAADTFRCLSRGPDGYGTAIYDLETVNGECSFNTEGGLPTHIQGADVRGLKTTGATLAIHNGCRDLRFADAVLHPFPGKDTVSIDAVSNQPDQPTGVRFDSPQAWNVKPLFKFYHQATPGTSATCDDAVLHAPAGTPLAKWDSDARDAASPIAPAQLGSGNAVVVGN